MRSSVDENSDITKEIVLFKINTAKKHNPENYILDVLERVEVFVQSQEIFSYHETMHFIEDQKTENLDVVMESLKSDLRSESYRYKRLRELEKRAARGERLSVSDRKALENFDERASETAEE